MIGMIALIRRLARHCDMPSPVHSEHDRYTDHMAPKGRTVLMPRTAQLTLRSSPSLYTALHTLTSTSTTPPTPAHMTAQLIPSRNRLPPHRPTPRRHSSHTSTHRSRPRNLPRGTRRRIPHVHLAGRRDLWFGGDLQSHISTNFTHVRKGW